VVYPRATLWLERFKHQFGLIGKRDGIQQGDLSRRGIARTVPACSG